MRFLLISCRASLRRNYHDEVMIRNSSDSGHEVSAEGRRSPDDRISRRPKGEGIPSLRGESEMRKRKLMFTLLAAATLMVNTSVWAGSDSEIENYTRYRD